MLNWKDPARTLRCVVALVASPSVEHVFIVDNESSGELTKALADAGVLDGGACSVTEVPENRGFAGGVNLGLRDALEQSFEAVLVINNDAVIAEESIALLIATLECEPNTGLVGPRIVHSDGSEESAGGYLIPVVGITSHRPLTRGAPDFITWACVLVRASALNGVGLLDERYFMYWEDVDFSLRLRAANWNFGICADATATHEISTNRKSYPIAIKAYHTWSAVVFAKKHRGVWLAGSLVWLLVSAGTNVLRRRPGALRGLRLGINLARENSFPAYLSQLRVRDFA
ncbi:glycosyltransferase [Cryobacterium sp. SO1]|uniref:glycosyltransferase n=1 Tax=Cryobacterium sp. SO1 TaxID=1897061 RepID=UPI0013EE6A16|nr:glycosyltransferase family 2 protein [Cryobacterium sp. SO1]